jgi:hypothetical protein
MTDTADSVKRYYEEVSYRNIPAGSQPRDPKGTTVTLLGGKVFGPIDVDFTWQELFEPDNKKEPWSAWKPKNQTMNPWDLLAGAFSGHLIDAGLDNSITAFADAVVFVLLHGSDMPNGVGDDMIPAQWIWPRANTAQLYWKRTPGLSNVQAVSCRRNSSSRSCIISTHDRRYAWGRHPSSRACPRTGSQFGMS